jgi:hypothetical protein
VESVGTLGSAKHRNEPIEKQAAPRMKILHVTNDRGQNELSKLIVKSVSVQMPQNNVAGCKNDLLKK